jgi:hypothetical protein
MWSVRSDLNLFKNGNLKTSNKHERYGERKAGTCGFSLASFAARFFRFFAGFDCGFGL